MISTHLSNSISNTFSKEVRLAKGLLAISLVLIATSCTAAPCLAYEPGEFQDKGDRAEYDQSAKLALRAIALHKDHRTKEALQLFQQAILAYPYCPAYYVDVGNCELQLGNRAQAVFNYKKAVSIKSDYADAWCRLGCTLLTMRDLPAAESALTMCLRVAPHYATALANLGIVYYLMHDSIKATRYFNDALATKDGGSPVWSAKINEYLAKIQYEKNPAMAQGPGGTGWGEFPTPGVPDRNTPISNQLPPENPEDSKNKPFGEGPSFGEGHPAAQFLPHDSNKSWGGD